MPHVKHLAEMGWEVHVSSADDGEGVPFIHKKIDIPIRRSPFCIDNFRAIKSLQKRAWLPTRLAIRWVLK